MRIDAYAQIQQMYNLKGTDKTKKAAPTGSFADKLQISGFGKDIQTAKKALAGSSDIREELVSPIKKKIAEGTYDVSSEDFADKLVDQYFM